MRYKYIKALNELLKKCNEFGIVDFENVEENKNRRLKEIYEVVNSIIGEEIIKIKPSDCKIERVKINPEKIKNVRYGYYLNILKKILINVLIPIFIGVLSTLITNMII